MNVRQLSTWQVYRPAPEPDGAGGQTVTLSQVALERGDVRELVGVELIEARQAGAEHTHSGYFRLRANIARNDELRRGGEVLQVLTVVKAFPPGTDRLRVTARTIEAGS
ncbi:MAG: head-tail adaptor protein [Acidimicrobiales bacterium]